MKMVVGAMVVTVLLSGCNTDPAGCAVCAAALGGGGGKSEALVSLQVTETQNREAFDKIMGELEARGLVSTILVDAAFAEENCARLQELHEKGYEIMAFVRPEAEEGESVTLSMLSYEEQEALITATKTAIEECLGEAISGFRCYRFDQNEDSYEIVDDQGFEFNLGFVAHSDASFAGHEDDTLPYEVTGYDFWAVPLHAVYYEDEWVTFCDMPCSSRMDGEEWGTLLIRELNDTRDEGECLITEVHPYYTGVEDDWFQAFVDFLDYAVQIDARFMTVEELVTWTEEEANALCTVCNE